MAPVSFARLASRSLALASAAMAAAAATSAWAHHGFGRFDRSQPLEIEGVITGIDFDTFRQPVDAFGLAGLLDDPQLAGQALAGLAVTIGFGQFFQQLACIVIVAKVDDKRALIALFEVDEAKMNARLSSPEFAELVEDYVETRYPTRDS